MNCLKSIRMKIIKSWDVFWDSYQLAYSDIYEPLPNELYSPFTFNYFGDPCSPSFYYIPDYHQIQNEV